MNQMDHLYVVTGGPGSGKSTLIEALAASGVPGMPEAGRAIIQDQVAIGGNALPWSDRQAFAELMLSWEMRSYRAALSRTFQAGAAASSVPSGFLSDLCVESLKRSTGNPQNKSPTLRAPYIN
jgi:predicted ATPase